MISASRTAGSLSGASLRAISSLQSGMFGPRNSANRFHKRLPSAPLGCEHFFTLRSQAVKPAPPLSFLFDPSPLDPLPFFETVQQRIEGGDVEAQGSFRAQFNQLADVVAVSRLILDQGK